MEIARRIEAALAGRVGANQHSPISDDPETGRSDDIAAKAVGLRRRSRGVTIGPRK